jgi:hypothetical protein
VILFPDNEQRTKKTFLPEKNHAGDETDIATLGEAENKQTNKQEVLKQPPTRKRKITKTPTLLSYLKFALSEVEGTHRRDHRQRHHQPT